MNLTSMREQRGAALIVALFILLMVSVMGLSAMRASMFSSKVALGVQADAMTFEAAESAIGGAFSALAALNDAQLYAAIGSSTTELCFNATGGPTAAACNDQDRFDERGLVKAESLSYLAGFAPLENTQVSTTGGAGVFVDYRINILGESEMPSYNIENHHLQEALKRGIKPGSDIE